MTRCCLGAALVLGLLGGHIAAASDVTNEYYVDEFVPLPKSGVAAVSLRAGPVEITEVRVGNMPTRQDLREDTRGRDFSRPKPMIRARNHGMGLATLTMIAILEDGKGSQLLRCSNRKPQELDGDAEDEWSLCGTEGMSTSDWPLVTHFHFLATVRVEEATAVVTAQPTVGADGRFALPFASAELTSLGAAVVPSWYSEFPRDAEYGGAEFADGVITIHGQVGLGKASHWAGVGLHWDLLPRAAPVDASRFKSLTLRLASSAKRLRLGLLGADPVVRMEGCYPVYWVDVTRELQELTIPLSRLNPESHCSMSQRAKVRDTLPKLTGLEVMSTEVDGQPLVISVGQATLNP